MKTVMLGSLERNPSDITFHGEDKDEKILYVLRKSLVINTGWVLGGAFLIIAPIFINEFFRLLNIQTSNFITPGFVVLINIFWYLVTLGYIFERFISWYFNVYIITDKRIVDMDFYNLLYRKVSDAPLRNIEDITYNVKGLAGTIFNFGDVIIQTAAERREFNFEDVKDPSNVQDILSDLVKEVNLSHAE